MMSNPSTDASPALDGRIRIASILVAALAMSVLTFGVVGTVIAKTTGGTTNPTLTVAIVSAAFFALIGSVLYRRFNYQPIRLRQVHAGSGETGLAEHLLRTTIVSAALAEVVAVFGLLMGVLTGDTYYLYALCAIALIGVISNFPRARRWRELSSEISAHTDATATASTFGIGGVG